MKCKKCGREFERKHNAQKYCEDCSALSRDLLNGKVFDNTKSQRCAYCKKEFHAGRKKKYCSSECMKQANLQKAKDERKRPGYIPPKPREYRKTCVLVQNSERMFLSASNAVRNIMPEIKITILTAQGNVRLKINGPSQNKRRGLFVLCAEKSLRTDLMLNVAAMIVIKNIMGRNTRNINNLRHTKRG